MRRLEGKGLTLSCAAGGQANTCANIPGFLAPMFSLAIRRWSGNRPPSSLPRLSARCFSLAVQVKSSADLRLGCAGGWGLSFAWPAVTLSLAAVAYYSTASLRTARESLGR